MQFLVRFWYGDSTQTRKTLLWSCVFPFLQNITHQIAGLPQMIGHRLGVDHGGRDRLMTHQVLDDFDVGPLSYQQRTKGVT